MITGVVILSYILIVYVDTYSIYKQKNKKDFYVSAALCLLSLIIAFLLAIGIKLPSPSPLIEIIVEGMFNIE